MIADFFSSGLLAWRDLNLASGTALALTFLAAAFLLIPRSVLLVAAGAAFGLKALLVIVPSTALGSILAFLLARYLLRSHFQRLVDKRPQFMAVAAAVDTEGWRAVAIMQLGVPVPSALQNYLFGLTRIGLMSFALTALLFSGPQVALFVYLGSTGHTLLSGGQASVVSTSSLLIGVLLTFVLISIIGGRARAQFRRISSPVDGGGAAGKTPAPAKTAISVKS